MTHTTAVASIVQEIITRGATPISDSEIDWEVALMADLIDQYADTYRLPEVAGSGLRDWV